MIDIESRLDAELFRRAFTNQSYRADGVGDRLRNGHIAEFNAMRDQIVGVANNPEREALAQSLLEAFADGYVKRLQSYIATESRIASAFIVGPARFPVAQMEKRRRVVEGKLKELYEWREYRFKRILKLVAGLGVVPVTRLEEIQANLAAVEAEYRTLKLSFAILRKHKGLDSPEVRSELIAVGTNIEDIEYWYKAIRRLGLRATNSGTANLTVKARRWRKELEIEQRRLAEAEVAPSTEQIIGGIRVEEHVADDRIRLFFPGKPDAPMITRLKGSGWRWSPSNGAWQRQLTNNARYNARHVILAGM